jgi:hypothetical protein
MSSSRSIAAARQRRGVESAPPIKNNNYASNSVNKDTNNNQQPRPNYKTTKSNIHVDNNTSSNVNNANQVSKLSVSDAFALVTIRLGRVEMIINKLQIEGIIDANNNIINTDNINSNNTSIDDTILQNIITRLDGLDKKTVSNDLNQKLQSQYNVLSEDVKQTKEMVMKLQSYMIEISHKLNTFVTTQENINEEFFDLRDEFNNNLNAINDGSNIISENETNQHIENDEAIDVNVSYDLASTVEILENDQTVDHETFESQNVDTTITGDLVDSFTETLNNTVEQVTTSDAQKNNKKNKNKTVNLNV